MPTSSNVLCGCGRFMRVKKNSVTVEEQLEGYAHRREACGRIYPGRCAPERQEA